MTQRQVVLDAGAENVGGKHLRTSLVDHLTCSSRDRRMVLLAERQDKGNKLQTLCLGAFVASHVCKMAHSFAAC